MVTLRVNFTSDRLVFHGPVTQRRYEYLSMRDNGQVDVEDVDVPKLKEITRTEGCKCAVHKDGSSGDQVQFITYNLFEDLSN